MLNITTNLSSRVSSNLHFTL